MRQVRVDRLVFVSEFLRQQARSKFPRLDASSVLYNGADQSIFYPAEERKSDPETTTVLFAGRLVADKGVHILLDAMRLLEKQGVRLQAQIVGSSSFGMGKETDYTRRLKGNSPASVVFLPYCSRDRVGQFIPGSRYILFTFRVGRAIRFGQRGSVCLCSTGGEYIRWQFQRDIRSWRGHSRRKRIRRPVGVRLTPSGREPSTADASRPTRLCRIS